MRNKILLCGPIPEPVGGVGIHIQRLSYWLKNNGYVVSHCDESPIKKENFLNIRHTTAGKYLKAVLSADIVHVHSGISILRVVHIFAAKILLKKVVITLHSWRPSPVAIPILKLFFRIMTNQIIYVSEKIARQVGIEGIVIPAYIKPNLELEPELPLAMQDWIAEQKKAGRTIVASNAYRLSMHNNEDLYGLDQIIDAFEVLEKNNFSFLYTIASPDGSKELLAKYKERINKINLKNSFYLNLGPVSFSRVLALSDISIRATNTDGDSLSVRESIDFGCITIASDAAQRPSDTLLYQSRNAGDMLNKIKIAESILKGASFRPVYPSGKDYSLHIDSVYKSFS